MDCIFCKIASGEIPTDFLYEDEYIVAFRDLYPQAPVHMLVVPKSHHDDLGDNVSEALAGHIFGKIPHIAHLAGVDANGYRTIVNTGAHAGQTVSHLHVHIMGGAQMSEKMILVSE